MRNLLLAGAVALASLSTAALAEEAVGVSAASAFTAKTGQLVYSSDSKKLGRIDRIVNGRAGIIVDQKYVYVPVESLSAGQNGRAVTSLTFKAATH